MEFQLTVFITAHNPAQASELAHQLAEHAESLEDAFVTTQPETWFSIEFGRVEAAQ